MKQLNYRTRRQLKKQRKKCTLTLTVEALEPRLVLSAVGFGFEGVDEGLDLHARDHGNRDTYRSAFTEKHHDERNSLRFEFSDQHTDRHDTNSNRLEFRSPPPGQDGHARRPRPHQPFSANTSERGRRESRFEDQSTESLDYFDGGKGESTFPTGEIEDFSSYESVDNIFEPDLFAASTIPSTTVVFISLTPTTSPARGNDSLNFEQPTTRLTQPPRSVANDSVSPQRGSGAVVLISSPASSRILPTRLDIESPISRFDSTSSDNDAVLVESASESTRITEPGIETFVSLATNDLARWWNLDDESFEAAFGNSGLFTESVRPSAAIERAVDSLMASADDQSSRLSEESLWAGVSEGGFIEIDAESADNSRERNELLEDYKDIANSRRLSTQTMRDAFWFDFGHTRLELILESTADEELAEEQALDNAADADEEAWLLDDGGMIVLTSSRFTDQAVEVAIDDTNESSSTSQSAAIENDIPMDAGIGVFHAIEVTAAPIEQQDPVETSEDTPVPVEREAAADVLPTAEQAAKKSDSGHAEPSRAASMPLLLAISAFLLRGRENQKKNAERQRKA